MRYLAIAERDGAAWTVRIEGLDGPAGLLARDLTDVEPRSRRLVAEATAQSPGAVDVAVEVRLPTAVQVDLDLLRQLYEDVVRERDRLIGALVEMRVPLLDIARVVEFAVVEPRPVTVTNRELADRGLDGHLDAVGVEWDYKGHFRTCRCRGHVDVTRREYRTLEPDGLNALVYADGPYATREFRCDLCDDGDDPTGTSEPTGVVCA